MNGLQGIEKVHIQILTRVWNYNKVKGDVDGDGDDDVAKAFKIQVAAIMDSLSRSLSKVRFLCFMAALQR
jgi:hypothetical protein